MKLNRSPSKGRDCRNDVGCRIDYNRYRYLDNLYFQFDIELKAFNSIHRSISSSINLDIEWIRYLENTTAHIAHHHTFPHLLYDSNEIPLKLFSFPSIYCNDVQNIGTLYLSLYLLTKVSFNPCIHIYIYKFPSIYLFPNFISLPALK